MKPSTIPGLGTSYLPLRELKRRASRIKLLVCDCDGVLTDGGMYYGPEGELMKRFDTRDGQGIGMARRAGIETAFLTREATTFAQARAAKLKVQHCFIGALEKDKTLAELQAKLGVTAPETAYIGDDVFDLPCVPLVSLFFCPGDGFLAAKDGIHVLLSRGGGRGAVRQAINFLLGCR